MFTSLFFLNYLLVLTQEKHIHTSQKLKFLKFKNSLDCLSNRINMKKKTVSELEDRSIKIIPI